MAEDGGRALTERVPRTARVSKALGACLSFRPPRPFPLALRLQGPGNCDSGASHPDKTWAWTASASHTTLSQGCPMICSDP